MRRGNRGDAFGAAGRTGDTSGTGSRDRGQSSGAALAPSLPAGLAAKRGSGRPLVHMRGLKPVIPGQARGAGSRDRLEGQRGLGPLAQTLPTVTFTIPSEPLVPP